MSAGRIGRYLRQTSRQIQLDPSREVEVELAAGWKAGRMNGYVVLVPILPGGKLFYYVNRRTFHPRDKKLGKRLSDEGWAAIRAVIMRWRLESHD